MSLEVLATGPFASIQDAGRPGYAALGVSPSGAADRAAYQLGNRLLGNPAGAAALETTWGGLVVRASAGLWCVVTGAEGPVLVDGRPVGGRVPFRLAAGGILEVGRPARGLRSYLAVRGGLATTQLLGSRSEDTLGRIVPEPVRVGTVLAIGEPQGPLPALDHPPLPHGLDPAPTLAVTAGPREDWLTEASRARFIGAEFTVTEYLDRVGVRLAGPVLERAHVEELASEGLVAGAVQVPPSGQPLIFLADHPTTGGYPVVAVVEPGSMSAVAQLRPGMRVRFAMAR